MATKPRSLDVRDVEPTLSPIESTKPISQAARPFSGHFLDRTEAAAKARFVYFKILLQRTCLIILAIFAIFSIYWGAVLHLPARNLEGWIVDFDGGRVGQAVVQDLSRLSGNGIIWKVHDADEFPNGASDLADAVVEEHCWVAVSINHGSTASLDAALVAGADTFYNGSLAVTAYGVEARNENALYEFLSPDDLRRSLLFFKQPYVTQANNSWLQQVTHDFSIGFIKELASNSSIRLSSVAPEVLVRSIHYSLENLRPFDVPV
ncbi:hypothetical protein DXG01_000863 [Tephrocybe rancida]|nr:hypothetical protein DXG01_000863 [Tephrocybe rancida]